MKKIKKFYRNLEWFVFSEVVKSRDNYQCQNCSRNNKEVILQVHHHIYYEGKKPWEYAISDCITLCKGCHAREHGLIEPQYGWTLISIDDLGDLSGICERVNCNTPIRYEHLAYHPQWGYKIIGSSCIEFLTTEDKLKSRQYLKLYRKLGKAFHKCTWEDGKTKNSNRTFLFTEYQKSTIRIYNDNLNYQVGFYRNKNYTKWEKPYNKLSTSNLDYIKELALINLMGVIAYERDRKEEHTTLQDIYRNVRKSIHEK